ncbi:penicillin-binding protein activator [Xanthomonas arboricola]|uniref:penicillin-binding protein activator n=1 Tax=Xanthomonas arboricola TaxID=56448 RepID=UPI000E0FD34A|nr:penicillin-binding protein activator [Xanthomonas arboricola]
MNKRVARISALSLMVMLAAGCATSSVTQTASPTQSAALALLDQGKPREAAQQLEAEAAGASGAQRSRLLAASAFGWHDAGDDARARTLLAQVNARHLSGDDRARFNLLTGELAVLDKQGAQALQALGDSPHGLPQPLQTRWLVAHAAALEATGDLYGAAAARARADASLSGTARSENQRAIVRLLAALDDATLKSRTAALPAGDPLYNFAGRAMISRGLALPRAFERDAQWGFDTSKRPPAERDGYRPPVKLGVLLPLTGNLATASAPVRDGLLAGYYAETRRRPEVQFFDTAGTAAGANAAYDKAVGAGVDYVVGPLGRDEVSALFARGQLAVPVLALNRPTDNKAPPSGSAGFSLAPEDDGIMAAEYLLARERRNVLIVGTSDDNGKRTIKAFRDRFSERGGTIAGSISVADVPGDIGAQLRNYGSADAVFLAVRGNTARALAPQLALSGFAGKSRVGTSQLVAGTGKIEDDLALDGIVYPSETWTALGVSGLPASTQVASTLPSARGPGARLFAFGYDAWKISAYLEKLATGTDGGLRGATGTLHLDGFGNVLRTPAWSTFNGGRPVPIADGR